MIKKTFFAFSMAVVFMFTAAVALCVWALYTPQAVFGEENTSMVVALDAGHGGIDGGVVGKTTKIKESDLNLSITMRLKEALEELGFEVVLTRKTEAGLYGAPTKGFKKRDMQKRKEIIQKAQPDLVISIHQNFFPSSSTRGAQVFYKKADENGKAFAVAVQEKLNALYEKQGARARSVMAGEYYILGCTPNPSVIVECGFLSNTADEVLLVDEVWQRRLADSVASGVVAYFADRLS